MRRNRGDASAELASWCGCRSLLDVLKIDSGTFLSGAWGSLMKILTRVIGTSGPTLGRVCEDLCIILSSGTDR